MPLSGAQRTEGWRRWKAGESLHTIGRAFDRPHTSIHCLLAQHGGIVPAVRRRADSPAVCTANRSCCEAELFADPTRTETEAKARNWARILLYRNES
jgi:hypothetical protein